MKTDLLTTIMAAAALCCGGALAQENPTATERLKDAAADAGDALQRAGSVILEESREAWTKTKEYFSNDPATYQQGANQKIEELNAELKQLRERSNSTPDRAYFQTRVLALEQQLQFARQQLTHLPPEEIRKGREGGRRNVDDVLGRLEEHLDIAHKEVADMEQKSK